VHWESEPDSERLDQLFAEADFVIYSGFEEETAPAVVESLWRGLPCLVHAEGTIASINPGPGLAVADMRDCSALAEAILKLADDDWRRYLANEAIARPVRSWDAYAREIAIELATDRLADGLHPAMPVRGDVYATLVNLTRRPKLSLCISTYNRAGWLQVNLRNIFAQIPAARGDLEVLVVDNTSTDPTPEVVKPYLDRTDFRYVRNPKNVGMLGNLAVTAQKAKGEYVWILGDDDLTRPGAIERVLQIIDQHPGIGLIYLNYGYTSEPDPASVGDLAAFLDGYNVLEPAGPDEFAPVKRLAAKCENFFTAIYSHVYRRDHALRSYCQNTSGRIFSTMLSCIPTAFYVLNYMAEEPSYWIGEPSLVVNSNVSWQDYGPLLDLEQLPRAWDLAERMGTDPGEVDRRRANRLWLVEMMWKKIFENDGVGNSAYFSAARVLTRLKHLEELDKHIGEIMSIHERARAAGHPAATIPTEELFSAFRMSPSSSIGSN
jgi:glycosyltransferase involved in cell wall biosynthesis